MSFNEERNLKYNNLIDNYLQHIHLFLYIQTYSIKLNKAPSLDIQR